jgi:general secretion pathway protein E
VLHPAYQVPLTVMNAMVARIKLLGRMDVVERRRPLDGRIKTRKPSGDEVEMRLSTLPTAFGEKLVMRIFDPDNATKDLDELGFSEYDANRWREITERPHGILLVTGPTGSGKTTTLYATLKRLATEEVNVSTIEDPIEMVEPAFNQTQVQPQLDFGFAAGVRALMRQDPDIIMVGEIRDLETAQMAVQAALTGHLVFASLHTNDAPSAVSRLRELGIPSYLLRATINGVLAQRLVRTLCASCKQPLDTGAALHALEQLKAAVAPFRMRINEGSTQLYRPVGCVDCRMTGYSGRIGLYELMTVDAELQAKITEEADIQTLRRHALTHSMHPLRLTAAAHVTAGRTTLEEILAATPAIEVEAPEAYRLKDGVYPRRDI